MQHRRSLASGKTSYPILLITRFEPRFQTSILNRMLVPEMCWVVHSHMASFRSRKLISRGRFFREEALTNTFWYMWRYHRWIRVSTTYPSQSYYIMSSDNRRLIGWPRRPSAKWQFWNRNHRAPDPNAFMSLLNANARVSSKMVKRWTWKRLYARTIWVTATFVLLRRTHCTLC